MISVKEALDRVWSQSRDFGKEKVALGESVGRVLREDIIADQDFPPFDRVTMDGIAIQFESFDQGQCSFEIEGIAAAGDEKQTLRASEKCLEIMTGAILPEGVDTVIRYEDIIIQNGIATLQVNTLKKGQNIHRKGEDRKEGTQIIREGIRMSSSEIGVCATVGKSHVNVGRLPKAIVISSGNELVDIEVKPLPHQIRKSNIYQIKSQLSQSHIDCDEAHLDDDYDVVVKKVQEYLEAYDIVLLSGGVSKGKFDFIPSALEELGVEKLFHKVKQRPGKPFWFGNYKNRCTIFAFPGNPVSSFMCAQRYFKPWLEKCLFGKVGKLPAAILTEDVYFKPDLTYFLQVKIEFDPKGQILARPVTGNGSGDLANLVDADAFLQLPEGREQFLKGEAFQLIIYRDLLSS